MDVVNWKASNPAVSGIADYTMAIVITLDDFEGNRSEDWKISKLLCSGDLMASTVNPGTLRLFNRSKLTKHYSFGEWI